MNCRFITKIESNAMSLSRMYLVFLKPKEQQQGYLTRAIKLLRILKLPTMAMCLAENKEYLILN